MKIFQWRQILPELHRLILGRRLRFEFEMIPLEARGLSLRKIANFFAAASNQYLKPDRPIGRPVIAQVEPSNYCNLSCPLCFTVSESGARPRETLSLETFARFLDDVGDTLLLIVLWNWGEPFLNPRLEQMISLATRRGILVHTSTNGNVRFSKERAGAIVASGLQSLVFALDGTDEETYQRYRQGGRLERVLANIRSVLDARRRANSRNPRVTLRFVAMQHNEHQIPAARELAAELGVDFFTVKSVAMVGEDGMGRDGEFAAVNQKYRMYDYEAGGRERKPRPFECIRPWKRVTLDAAGNVIPCEFDHRSRYSCGAVGGGASTTGIWKNRRARSFRRGFNLGHNDTYLCRNCIYKGQVADDCTVEALRLTDLGT